ncbi:MAG: hypothetical protein DK302_000025 [Chloroflexi bacterium]|jgi:hypothetical protein|nr:MAG: hypothetical protein DK302_000025 [Chloroflexota bacterium]
MTPLFEIIDVEILLCWHHESLEYWSNRGESSSKILYGRRHKSNIFKAVKNKMQFGFAELDLNSNIIELSDKSVTWAKIYPEWFDRPDWDDLGAQRTIDHRIQSLINKGFIQKVPRVMMGHSRDMYRMELEELTRVEWEILNEISSLEPKHDFAVPNATQFNKVLRVNV